MESGSRYFDHRLLLGAQHCGGQCSFVVPGVVKNEPQWLNSATCIHDLMKTLIVCVSEHHGNTKKIAGAMAAVLDAEVSHPDDVNVEALGDYDLIGLGSGIALESTISVCSSLLTRFPRFMLIHLCSQREGHPVEGRTTLP